MVAKVYGFLTGAGITAVAIFGFNAWRHVSDDDRLTLVLRDHCLPYVVQQITPFTDIGRTPGVFDNVSLPDGTRDGGSAIIFDGRFVAKWGVSDREGLTGPRTLRVCSVEAMSGSDDIVAFQVDAGGFAARYTDIIASVRPLKADDGSIAGEGGVVIWSEPDLPADDGLRVLMIGQTGAVVAVSVVMDVSD